MYCPFHNGSGPVYSTCYRGAGWSQGRVVSIISEAQCWSLLLADWALSGSYSQVSLGEFKFMLLNPCITSVSATMALCSWAHWAMTDEGGWGKRLSGIYRTVHPIYLIITILLFWDICVCSGVQISLSFALCERNITLIFLRFLCHQFFNHISSKSLTIQPKLWLQAINGLYSLWPVML